jgi:opacity protein-like surface antigen
MRSVKLIIAAGAASLLSPVAFAADMASPIMPPPPMSYAPPPVEDFGGWYLRGDIGFSNQNAKSVLDTNSAAYNNVNVNSTGGFGTAGIFDLGVGYRFNNWFRVDATGQYRGNSNFTGLDTVVGTGPNAGFIGTDSYTATKSEWVALVNAYADLGTWWCITPFVGAGIGTARVSIANFTDTGDFITVGGTQAHSFNYAGQASQWNFAWALHAGLAYKVSPGLTVELAYTYLDMGKGLTGPTNSFDGVTNTTHAPFSFNNITSNDVMLGVRWELNSPPVYAPPPLIRKG